MSNEIRCKIIQRLEYIADHDQRSTVTSRRLNKGLEGDISTKKIGSIMSRLEDADRLSVSLERIGNNSGVTWRVTRNE